MTTSDAFATYRENLKLEPDEFDRAVQRHEEMRAALADAKIVERTFLQGSMARKTMIPPLKDIDIVGLLHHRLHEHRDADSGVEAVQKIIAEAIQNHFPRARLKWGKHALLVAFHDVPFTFDVVPAYDNGDDEHYDLFIINTKTGAWEPSNSRSIIRAVQAKNEECRGNFIHQARMARDVVKSQLDGKVPGLLAESAAFWDISGPVDDDVALAGALKYLADHVDGGLLEPSGHDDLADKIKQLDRPHVKARLRSISDTAQRALSYRHGGDHNAAIEEWGTITSDAFPDASPQTEDEAIAALARPGSITSSGRVSSVHGGGPAIIPARSWRSH
jgi:hypothetical protein